MHISVLVLLSAGMNFFSTVGDPGTQGPTAVLGMHGIGVSTPMAAAVAAATCGLAGLVHIPKGGMFAMGLLSMMLPASMKLDMIIFGVAMKLDGATPKVHIITAPVTTCMAIGIPFQINQRI
jgi:hypothetical protein